MPKNGNEVFAPKGLLKMIIMKLASTRPVTGVEIMSEVPKMTESLWSPSPGSVYYLLGRNGGKRSPVTCSQPESQG